MIISESFLPLLPESELPMWHISANGFISIVRDRTDPDKVWVRARVKEDLIKFLPDAYADLVQTDPKADYCYRICVPKLVVAFQMWNEVIDIDYTSHAKEVMNRRSHPNAQRMTAMYDVWETMSRMQDLKPFGGTPRKVVSSSIKYRPVSDTYKKTVAATAATGTGGTVDMVYGRDFNWDDYADVMPREGETWPLDDGVAGAQAAETVVGGNRADRRKSRKRGGIHINKVT